MITALINRLMHFLRNGLNDPYGYTTPLAVLAPKPREGYGEPEGYL